MTKPAVPPTESVTGASHGTSFESFDALQRADLEFRRSLSERKADSERVNNVAGDIRSFIARARATGAIITGQNDRNAAQSMLDYWSSELVCSPGVIASDFMPALLASPDPVRASHASDQPASTEAKSDQLSREIIRFAATARLWRD